MNPQKKKLKVLELIDDADIGGGQRHVLLLAAGLNSQGVDVSVACAPSGYLVNELRKKNIPLFSVGLENWPRLGQLMQLVRHLRDGQYDILHTHGGTAGLWGRLAAKLVGVRMCVHTYHGIHSAYRKNPVVRWILMSIEKMLLPFTSQVICVSKGDYELGRRHGLIKKNHTSVIPNGIEVERFAATHGRQKIREEFGVAGHEVLVGTIGRLHFQKGLVYLLEAVQIVLQQRSDVKFLLVGDGPQRELLQQKIAKLGVAPAVHMAGTRHDVPELLAAFDIFVLASLWEGLPLVLLEASAAGKPIVATAVEGTKEIIQDGFNGFLVPSENPRSLADAILRVSTDANVSTTLAKKAQEIARERYSVDHMVAQTMNLYIETSEAHGIT